MTAYEMLEFEVCQQVGIPSIPEPIGPDSNEIWVLAVAKIITRDMKPSFAIVRNNLTDKPMVIKCFSTGGIGRIESVHPYMRLDRSILPKGKAALVRTVADAYGVSVQEFESLPEEKQKKATLLYAIGQQMAAVNKIKREEEEIRRRIERDAEIGQKPAEEEQQSSQQ